ncbi:MAG: hypothetical protein ACAH80_03860 [Alphaproteobacteria bacterium]
MISNAQYTARSAFAGEVRTAGQVYGVKAKKSAEADAAVQMVDKTGGVEKTKAAQQPAKSSHKFSFKAFILGLLDIINPLQHIPVISTIYRKITGDEISPMARVAGDALYGGPIGAAVGLADVVVEKKTGKDIGQNVMAMVSGDHKPKHAAKTEVAAATPAQKKDDIIWDDDMQQAAMKLTVHPQKAASRDDMLKQKMNAQAPQKAAAKQAIASPTAQALLQAQQVPKDEIAQKMMEGLDKYRAMRGTGTAF